MQYPGIVHVQVMVTPRHGAATCDGVDRQSFPYTPVNIHSAPACGDADLEGVPGAYHIHDTS